MNGIYVVEGEYLHIEFPVKLVGESRDGTIIEGGIKVAGNGNDETLDLSNLFTVAHALNM